MNTFQSMYSQFLETFGQSRTMVLSTSENSKVTSRMMSIVQLDGAFYFQTDKTFRKYEQIVNNPNVALCIDNIQIEGICEEIGHPQANSAFCNIYQACYNSSYKKYSSLSNERLFKIKPTYIERWIYKDGVPFLEIFDIAMQTYKLNEYKGV